MELAAVVVFFLMLIGSSLVTWLPVDTLLTAGGWTLAVGVVVGVPAGLLYHVFLYRALRRLQQLPKGWYWRPLTLHDRLPPGRERNVVLFWCYLGGAGFFVIVAGALPIFMALWRVLMPTE